MDRCGAGYGEGWVPGIRTVRRASPKLPRARAEGCKHCQRAVNSPFTGRGATKLDVEPIRRTRPAAAEDAADRRQAVDVGSDGDGWVRRPNAFSDRAAARYATRLCAVARVVVPRPRTTARLPSCSAAGHHREAARPSPSDRVGGRTPRLHGIACPTRSHALVRVVTEAGPGFRWPPSPSRRSPSALRPGNRPPCPSRSAAATAGPPAGSCRSRAGRAHRQS